MGFRVALTFITGYNNVGKTFYMYHLLVEKLRRGERCILLNTLARSRDTYSSVEKDIVAHLMYAYRVQRGTTIQYTNIQKAVDRNYQHWLTSVDLLLNIQENLLVCNNVELLDLYNWSDATVFVTDDCAEDILVSPDIQYIIHAVNKGVISGLVVDVSGSVSSDFVGATKATDLFVSSSDDSSCVDVENVHTGARSSVHLHLAKQYEA